NRTTFLFSPSDRTKAWNTRLERAKSNTSITYRDMPITLDLSKPTDISEVGPDLFCTVVGTCQDFPVFHETFDFIVKISAEGVIRVVGVKAPTFAEAVAEVAKKDPSSVSPPLDANDVPGGKMKSPLDFFIDWGNVTLLSTGSWHYDCVAPGVVNLQYGRY